MNDYLTVTNLFLLFVFSRPEEILNSSNNVNKTECHLLPECNFGTLLFSKMKTKTIIIHGKILCISLSLINNLVLGYNYNTSVLYFQYLLLAISSLSVFPSSWYSSSHLPL